LFMTNHYKLCELRCHVSDHVLAVSSDIAESSVCISNDISIVSQGGVDKRELLFCLSQREVHQSRAQLRRSQAICLSDVAGLAGRAWLVTRGKRSSNRKRIQRSQGL